MAKKKKHPPTKGHIAAHVERVRKVQANLVLELKKIKKEVEEMGVLGAGAAKKKVRK